MFKRAKPKRKPKDDFIRQAPPAAFIRVNTTQERTSH